MAAQTLILLNPAFISSPHQNPTSKSLPASYSKHNIYISHVSNISPSNPKLISPVPRKSKIFSSSSDTQNPTHSPLTEPTRTVTTFLAITLSISRLFSEKIKNFGVKLKKICTIPTPDDDELLAIEGIKGNLICSMGPMFFAAAINKGPRALNTPLTVVAAGMSKWLEIYSAVLMVRVLLSWFPNIPWDRQPLSAIRDLCDPYLNLFRNIIPPLFDTLDVSPLLAFAVLGSLAGILGATTKPY